MFTNDQSDTSPRRRRIIQAPLRTEPPIALIGADGRVASELEALLNRRHALIQFPSLSHFLAAPPARGAWAAIVMARPSAWDVRLERYVGRRRQIALFAQPEEGYGWPEEVARIRDNTEVDAWLERLRAPEPEPVLKKLAREKPARAPRQPAAPAPSPATPSWLEQDARVWDALGSSSADAEAKAVSEPSPAPAAKLPSRRPPEQLALAAIAAAAPAKAKAKTKAERKPAPVRREAASATRSTTRSRVEQAAQADAQSAQRSAALVRSVLSEKRPPDVRGELAFLQAAAEVGIVRAEELLQQLHARAATLA